MIKASELTQSLYRTGEVAKLLGVNPRTVRRGVDNGTIKGKVSMSGHCRIEVEEVKRQLELRGMLYDDSQDKLSDYIYARVSRQELVDCGDLDAQIAAVTLASARENLHNLTIVSDVSSGENANREGLNSLIDDAVAGKINRVFVSSRDQLATEGYVFLEKLLSSQGVTIVVVNS